MNNYKLIENYFRESSKTKLKFISSKKNKEKIVKLIEKIKKCLKKGNKILICGNGGSAADAQHIAAEFIVRFNKNRRSLPAIALTTDSSILTAIGNDFGFERVFEKQIEGVGNKGDILIAISTSGNSENIIRAVKKAKKKKMYTVGLLGKKGGILKKIVDLPIIVPSEKTSIIQECHLTIYHFICMAIENELKE